jgi:poly(hydroxyalkanoate) depolymerase family esterase
MKQTRLIILFLLLAGSLSSQKLEAVKNFGNNPGRLQMYLYNPASLAAGAKAPLVIVLHGCFQNAKIVAKQTDWNKLADQYGFRVVYPQQRMINNPCRCFDFYRPKDINKNSGENLSVEQMVEYMISNYHTDSANIYITGLSAGAALSVVEMADYPQLFKAGAIFAGGAYRSATNIFNAWASMEGFISRSPQHWAELVHAQNPDYKGSYPKMIIYQGNADLVVNPRNAKQLVKQWTGLYNIPAQPTQVIRHFIQVKGLDKSIYSLINGTPAVICYKIRHMGHALPIAPGHCEQTGGHMTPFSANKKFFSTYWTAVDFGLITAPQITGKTRVMPNEQVTYTVPANNGSTYKWKFPKDCKVLSNTGNNTLIVVWGSKPGNIDLTETNGTCKKVYATLGVEVN